AGVTFACAVVHEDDRTAARQSGRKAKRKIVRAFLSCISASSLLLPASAMSCCRRQRLPLRLREQHAERRSRAGRRLHLDVAVVHLDSTINHREADTAALLFGGEVQVENAL